VAHLPDHPQQHKDHNNDLIPTGVEHLDPLLQSSDYLLLLKHPPPTHQVCSMTRLGLSETGETGGTQVVKKSTQMQHPAYATSGHLVSWALPRVIGHRRLKIDNQSASAVAGLMVIHLRWSRSRRMARRCAAPPAPRAIRCICSRPRPTKMPLVWGQVEVGVKTNELSPSRSSSAHQLKTTASTNSNTKIAITTSYHGGRPLYRTRYHILTLLTAGWVFSL
jgi:hypothetical protein